MHIDEVNKVFTGEKYSKNTQNPAYNVKQIKDLNTYGNSGAGCISMAAQGGASRIILIGFDAQHTNGRAHWFGNHPVGLGNAGMTDKWLENFEKLKQDFSHIDIINASRETAITCFRRARLEDLL